MERHHRAGSMVSFSVQVGNDIFFRFYLTKAEVGGLMWKDVDFNEKCLRINRSLSCQYEYGKKMLRLLSPKTHNSYRKIPFFGEAEEMLLQQKAKTDCLKKALGNRFRATGEYADLVFVTTM